MNLKERSLKKLISFVGGSASPFIDKRGGFTGEKKRVRMFLSLVGHARMRVVMMVGTHNTVDVAVERQVHMGGCIGFFRKGGRRYLRNAISI